jgi:adenine-specific DNA methylase
MNFIESQSPQKLRGGYYTPEDLAAFLVRWVQEISPTRILEPSSGDGAFLRAIATEGLDKTTAIKCFELDEIEAGKVKAFAQAAHFSGAEVHPEDFLGWALRAMRGKAVQFDAVLGNPPFVRYQYLPEQFQARSEQIFAALDLPFTKHTNAWVPFILASISLLRPGGRLAMVVPAEIIHVMHAQSLRTHLGRECSRIVIVDPEQLWFEDTLQGAVLLMAQKKLVSADHSEGLGIYSVRGKEFLVEPPAKIFQAPKTINGKTVQGKWTRALLDAETLALFDSVLSHEDVHVFDDVAQVDVGIVTGANKFFLVSDEVVHKYKLQRWAHPMFGRSEHCPGVIYDDAQHKANATAGNPTNFLWFTEPDRKKFGKSVSSYIDMGEGEKLHTRYKCRIRSPWYTVPSVYATEIGMLKRSHDIPRLILNEAGAYTTDTAYRIRSKIPAKKLVQCFVNPLTALSAELEGRHYGGGVLELVPSEIEKLAIPLPKKVGGDLRKLDKMIRSAPTEEVLSAQGEGVLTGLGLSKDDRQHLLKSWRKLRDRRQRTTSDA